MTDRITSFARLPENALLLNLVDTETGAEHSIMIDDLTKVTEWGDAYVFHRARHPSVMVRADQTIRPLVAA